MFECTPSNPASSHSKCFPARCNHVKLTARNAFDGSIQIGISVPKSHSFALCFLYDYYGFVFKRLKYVWNRNQARECCVPQKHPLARKKTLLWIYAHLVYERYVIRMKYDLGMNDVRTTSLMYAHHGDFVLTFNRLNNCAVDYIVVP